MQLGKLWSLILLSMVHIAPWAGESKLSLGDAAPQFSASKWLNGGPVAGYEKGKVYVLAFWASFHIPSKNSMAHISELNTKLKDKGVIFAGLSVKERNPDSVEGVVKELADKINFPIALDVIDGGVGKNNKIWLDATGLQGLPWIFIIDQAGKIAWIGEPAAMDAILDQVVAGTFDIVKYKERLTKLNRAQGSLEKALQTKNGPEILKALDELTAIDPSQVEMADALRFKVKLLLTHQSDEAYILGAKAADGVLKNNAIALADFAWTVMDAPDSRNLDLALKWALRADELTKHEDPDVLTVLAKVYNERGKPDKAVEVQTVGLANAKDARSKADMSQRLESYKKAVEQKKLEEKNQANKP